MVEIERSEEVIESVRVGVAKPFVVVGIPAYNEEDSIARVVIEAQKFADAIIVCDDGSSDMTAKIAARLGADVVKHERNQGYGAALKSLFERARHFDADVLVTLDADGQHNPAEIPRLLKPITAREADIVIGSRFAGVQGKQEMPLYRRFGAKIITRMVNGSAKNGVRDSQSGFRAYNRQAISRLNVIEAGMGASVEILLKASKSGLRIQEVPSSISYKNGAATTSGANPVSHGLSVIMSVVRLIVEERPLMYLGIPGLLCMLAGVSFGIWMLQIYAVEHNIVTNIALASIALVLVSFFMLSTAITLYAIARLSGKVSSEKWETLE